MLPPYYFYWFRIDNKHKTEPWLDQALMDKAYKSADAELQPSSVRGGGDFTVDFTFVHDHFFNNFQLN